MCPSASYSTGKTLGKLMVTRHFNIPTNKPDRFDDDDVNISNYPIIARIESYFPIYCMNRISQTTIC